MMTRLVRIVFALGQVTIVIRISSRNRVIITLGAMTKQPFQGRVRFELDTVALDLEWDSEAKSTSAVRVSGAAYAVEAAAAEFRGTRWVNLTLPIKKPGAPEGLRLEFLPQCEDTVGLPAAGRYRVRTVDG